MKRRRLCMVVHGPYPLGEPRVEREAAAALDAGWQVDVVAMRNPGEPAEEDVEGVTVLRLPLRHKRGGGILVVAREYLGFTALASVKVGAMAVRRGYRVVHVHNPPDFLVLAGLMPRLLGARVVFDIHDSAPQLFATRFGTGWASTVMKRMLESVEWLATRFASAVVTAQISYRRALEAGGMPSEKITLVLNTLDERRLPESAAPVECDAFRVVYHGTVTPLYAIELLVEATANVAPDVPQLKLEIYGDGDGLDQVRLRVEEFGLTDRVYLSGRFLPLREVLARVCSASVGVVSMLPNEHTRDNVPTKLFEYAFLGVPIVSVDLPAIRELFSPQEVRFFRAGDAKDLSEALRDVIASPEAARERAAAARRRYEEYRWSSFARRYVELLERLAAA